MVMTPSRDDAAEVLLEGRVVGRAYWSMSDEPGVCVIVEPTAMSLVLQWAMELVGEFSEYGETG